MRTISLTALRRIAISAQGYATRSRTGTRREVEEAIRALSCVQLDSITAVERSHRITLGSRVGAYPRETVSRLLGQGRIFEYWAHEACLIPVEEWPLFRAPMRAHHPWRGDVIGKHPELAEEVRAAVRERGPITSRDFEGDGGGGMWNWKPAKVMLEALWNAGEIVIAGRVSGFQRSYDLAERVIPRAVLDAPEPDAETRLRELTLRAIRARGALTERGVVEHWRLRGGAARIRPHSDALVADGILERVRVDDGGAEVLVVAGADLDPPRPTAAALLSPFDNLLWDRPFAQRVLAFEHLIEVYKPAPQRRFGYYVLPFLWRDRIVGRADLKTERREGALVVAGADLDPPRPTAAALLSPFDNLLWDRPFAQRVLGFEHLIEVYKPAPQRRFGYYVLPFLWRDRIVGRADLKTERREGALVVKALHLEPGVRHSAALDDALDRVLDRLRRTVGLEHVRR